MMPASPFLMLRSSGFLHGQAVLPLLSGLGFVGTDSGVGTGVKSKTLHP